MKINMKIYEFLNNDETINKIDELIYFDEKWIFPEYNLKEYLEIDDFESFYKLAKIIVNELNSRNIDPDEYDKDILLSLLDR
jgi:hypothetical protein